MYTNITLSYFPNGKYLNGLSKEIYVLGGGRKRPHCTKGGWYLFFQTKRKRTLKSWI